MRVRQLQKENPNAKESYLKLKDELRSLGVTPSTTYLYIQGHHLFDNIIVPVLKRVCDLLVREREDEINRNAVHDTNVATNYQVMVIVRRRLSLCSVAMLVIRTLNHS